MAQRLPLQVRSSNGVVFDSHCPPSSLPLDASAGFPDVQCFTQRPVAANAMPSSQMQQFYLPCNGSGNGHDVRRPDIADIEQDLQASSLMRYHSAPSSMLASISIGMREEYVAADTAELARMIPVNVVSCPSVQFESRSFQQVNEACSFSDGGRVVAVKREDEVQKGDANGHNDPNISRLISAHSPLKQTAASIGYPVLGVELQGVKNGNSHLRTSFASPPLHPTTDYAAESKEIFRSGCDNGTDHIMNPSVRFSPPCKSSLLRHSSSPAGFLSLLNDGMAPPSSSGNSSEEGTYEQAAGNYLWPDSIDASGNVILGSPVLAGKRAREGDSKFFAGGTISDPRQRELLEHGAVANHSLPMSSSPKNPYILEGASLDSVLCHARAKRGCATHPRSIAERVRRTKITERIKKLQELVPHMDKQTNTVEMLDEVMEYVKCLQRQVQELKEAQSKCTCNCKKSVPDGS